MDKAERTAMDMRLICETLGFDPSNHHNAALCPYCTPAAKPAPMSTSGEMVEHDPDDHSREYIPLPGGWEVQTMGAGSSYRLLDKKTGERHLILSGKDWMGLQAFFTRFAHEVFAASREERKALEALFAEQAGELESAESHAQMLLLAVEAGDPKPELAMRVKDLISVLSDIRKARGKE